MLSVPGKRDNYCAEKILHSQLSPLTSHLSPLFLKMVHRLDMDTSGVILAAKTPEMYKAMQRMFSLHEEVQKEYVALLSPPSSIRHHTSSIFHLPSDIVAGRISLPLSADFYNRPRQIVDYEGGKEAVTDYEFLSHQGGALAVRLKPLTGRTHQLRVHCAHPDGLGMPILGDPLYGSELSDRMYLHAASLAFVHPMTGQKVTIESPLPEEIENPI
jgi:tRNA pseudouridine32 synthase/23S rRNA pseudouridine746 synthase